MKVANHILQSDFVVFFLAKAFVHTGGGLVLHRLHCLGEHSALLLNNGIVFV